MLVLVAVRTQTNLADDLDHEFGAQRTGHLLVIDDDLHQTGVVAKIDEGHATVVAATIDPTGERHLLTDELFGHFGCMMCSVSRLAHASPIPYPLVCCEVLRFQASTVTVCWAYTVSGSHDCASAGRWSPVMMFLTSSWAPSSEASAGNQTYGMPSLSAYLICLPSLAAVGATSAAMPRERSWLAIRLDAERRLHSIPPRARMPETHGWRARPRCAACRRPGGTGRWTGPRRVLLVALRCEVVVTAAGADGAQSGGAVEERLIHGTGVVIKTTGDFQIGDHGARTDARGLVDDHRQRVESLACQHVGVGIRRDVMLGAQCVELVGQFLAVGGGQLGQFEAGTGLGFVAPQPSTSSLATSSAPILSSLSISRSTPSISVRPKPR